MSPREKKGSPEVRFTFNKAERLCSKKVIDKLFSAGRMISVYPLKIVYMEIQDQDVRIKAGFNVGKRNFRLAVHRNLIKRRIKEAYRLNKSLLLETLRPDINLALFILYTGKEISGYSEIENAMKIGINKLIEKSEEK